MKWLCKFKLEPVESKGIKFILTDAELCFYNYPGEFIVDQREFDVMVGTNSQLGIFGRFTKK